MKALAVLQLVLAVVQVVAWVSYRRNVKRSQARSQRSLEVLTADLYNVRLDGCTCPPDHDKAWHFRGCLWAM